MEITALSFIRTNLSYDRESANRRPRLQPRPQTKPKAYCQNQSVTPVQSTIQMDRGKVSVKIIQNILNAGIHFTEDILHYGKPKTIQLVFICMGYFSKNLIDF